MLPASNHAPSDDLQDNMLPQSHWADSMLAAFDLETTGLDAVTDEIVQAAFILIQPDGTLHPDSWSTIVNPGQPIPPDSTAVHGITQERAAAEGIPAVEAHHHILDRLQHAAMNGIPVVVYNAPFDIGFMHVRAARLGRVLPDPVVFDPLTCDRALDKYRRDSRKLIDMAAHYGCTTDQLHDARFDCMAAVAVARAIAKRFPRVGTAAPEELRELQASWYRNWATNFEDYLERQGRPSQIDPGWPIPERLLPAPEVASGASPASRLRPWWRLW